MNGTTEICNENGNQTRVYQDSKWHGGGTQCNNLLGRWGMKFIYFGVWAESSALAKTCEILSVNQDSFIVFADHSLYK